MLLGAGVRVILGAGVRVILDAGAIGIAIIHDACVVKICIVDGILSRGCHEEDEYDPDLSSGRNGRSNEVRTVSKLGWDDCSVVE